MIIIESKRKKTETLLKKHPDAILADVTSKAKDGLVKLSPFYPHYGIPVPFSPGYTATCVEAVWQGLKVFEGCDVDTSLFTNDTMRGLKRTVRKYGKPLGHRKGVNGTELLGYIEARKQIYMPTYQCVLENKVKDIIDRLREVSKTKTIVLLDYDTNADVDNGRKPLSHASLRRMWKVLTLMTRDKRAAVKRLIRLMSSLEQSGLLAHDDYSLAVLDCRQA